MRPLATSWPPECRTADANGAAHAFSQTSTAAVLSGSSASATLTTSSSLKTWAMSISSFSISPATPGSRSLELESFDRAVGVLGDEDEVEHLDDVAVDEIAQCRSDLAVELVARELDDDVVDGPELIDGVSHAVDATPVGAALSGFGTIQDRHRHRSQPVPATAKVMPNPDSPSVRTAADDALHPIRGGTCARV